MHQMVCSVCGHDVIDFFSQQGGFLSPKSHLGSISVLFFKRAPWGQKLVVSGHKKPCLIGNVVDREVYNTDGGNECNTGWTRSDFFDRMWLIVSISMILREKKVAAKILFGIGPPRWWIVALKLMDFCQQQTSLFWRCSDPWNYL